MASTTEIVFKTHDGGLYKYTEQKSRGVIKSFVETLEDSNANEFPGTDGGTLMCAVYGPPAVGYQFRTILYVDQDGEQVRSFVTSPVTQVIDPEELDEDA
jgi:hypothetical protein